MKLLYSILITLGVGAVSGIATASNIDAWYAHLSKPTFNPPNALFGPVWTVLYILMGISLYMIWKLPPSVQKNKALRFFFLQLTANFLWSFIFFYFHQIGLALIEIIFLLFLILVTLVFFAKLNRTAAWLLLPYIFWVSFATVLNGSIFLLNR